MAWCAQCRDEFDPVEYRQPSVDDPNFCSDLCEEEYADVAEGLNFAAYDEARYFGAPVH